LTSTDQELEALKHALASSTATASVQPAAKSALDELKETLEALKTINPTLVDSSRIFEHLLTLIDASSIASGTNSKIDALTQTVVSLHVENKVLAGRLDSANSSIQNLTASIEQNNDWMDQFKERSLATLAAIEQYLRTHS
jgi:hypothetical protein